MTPKEEVEEAIAIKRRETRMQTHRTKSHSHAEIKLNAGTPREEL